MFDKIKNALQPSTYTASDPQIDYYRSYTGQDVSLLEIMRRLKTAPMFGMVVRVSADQTVGQGFTLTAKSDAAKSQEALDLTGEFCDDINMDALLQECAIDLFACGNVFMEWGRDGSLKKIPASEITQINVDSDGNPQSFRRQRNGVTGLQDVPAADIMHLAWQKLDVSPFGEGLGQMLCRPGYGYKDPNGNYVCRPPLFEIEEMVTDVTHKQLYAGLPRWIVNVGKSGKAAIDDVVARMKKQKPLDHIVTNSEVKAEEIALAPSNKMDSMYKHIYNTNVMAHMSPLPTLWQDMSNFAYNSAEAALQSALPLISAAQRALKRFVEREIFKPLLEKHGYEWHKHRVSISFGPEETLNIEDIQDLVSILKEPQFQGRYDPEDVLDLIRDAGIPLHYMTTQMRDSSLAHATRVRKKQHMASTRRRAAAPEDRDKLIRKHLRRM